MNNKQEWDGYFGQGGQGRPQKIREVVVFEVDPKDKKPAGRRYREQVSGHETAVIKAPGSKNHFMVQEQKDVARELKEKGGGCVEL